MYVHNNNTNTASFPIWQQNTMLVLYTYILHAIQGMFYMKCKLLTSVITILTNSTMKN